MFLKLLYYFILKDSLVTNHVELLFSRNFRTKYTFIQIENETHIHFKFISNIFCHKMIICCFQCLEINSTTLKRNTILWVYLSPVEDVVYTSWNMNFISVLQIQGRNALDYLKLIKSILLEFHSLKNSLSNPSDDATHWYTIF